MWETLTALATDRLWDPIQPLVLQHCWTCSPSNLLLPEHTFRTLVAIRKVRTPQLTGQLNVTWLDLARVSPEDAKCKKYSYVTPN